MERELSYGGKYERDKMFVFFLDPIGKEREISFKSVQPGRSGWRDPHKMLVIVFLPNAPSCKQEYFHVLEVDCIVLLSTPPKDKYDLVASLHINNELYIAHIVMGSLQS